MENFSAILSSRLKLWIPQKAECVRNLQFVIGTSEESNGEFLGNPIEQVETLDPPKAECARNPQLEVGASDSTSSAVMPANHCAQASFAPWSFRPSVGTWLLPAPCPEESSFPEVPVGTLAFAEVLPESPQHEEAPIKETDVIPAKPIVMERTSGVKVMPV